MCVSRHGGSVGLGYGVEEVEEGEVAVAGAWVVRWVLKDLGDWD